MTASENSNGAAMAATFKRTYDEMRTRQRKAILQEKSMRADSYFAKNPARMDDDRRCLAISCVMNDENLADSSDCLWTDAYRELQGRLKELCPGVSGKNNNMPDNDPEKQKNMRFGQSADVDGGICGQLHFTLMQLVGFPDYEVEMQGNSIYTSSQYMDCVQDALIVGGMDAEVKIHFIGCIAVSTGLLMIGVPDATNLNQARDCVREKLSHRGFPLKEPFVNDIVHSTLFRVTDNADPALYQKTLDLAKEFERVHLGTLTLRNFQIGPASWRMLPEEIAATPPWRKWTLPHLSTQEEYQNGVVGAPETRSCFTVSGASGRKLAQELKKRLEMKRELDGDREYDSPGKGDRNEECKKQDSPVNAMLKLSMTMSPFRKDERITEERAYKENDMNLCNFNIKKFNSPYYKNSGYDGPICIHTELNEQVEDEAKDDIMAKNAVTVSGASGLMLAQELQKRLEMEKQRLVSVYQKDFF